MANTNGVLGNSIDIHVGKNDHSAEIRADVKVEEFNSKRIWGQVVNYNNEPVTNSLVKLVRVVCNGNKKDYEGVAHTITDCEGFYQFDVCDNNDNECYKIIINKAVTGQELVIDTMGGNCGYCNNDGCGNGGNGGNGGYNPCMPYNPIVKPYNPNECNCNGGNNSCNNNNNNNSCGCNCDENNHNHCKSGCQKTNYATYTR